MTKVRNSNLELFRIITMLLIVSHHYVVNSDLILTNGPIYSDPLSLRSLYLLIFGAWGKIGINCFLLITGYFMSRSQITFKKYLKLLLQIVFYNIVLTIFFGIIGYTPFTIWGFIKMFLPITSVGTGFTSAFILFYLFIPFINKLIDNMSELQHIKLLFLYSFIYIFLGTLPSFSVTMNYITWFAVLYLIASYIRIYPKKIFSNATFWKTMLIISITASVLSVVAGALLSKKTGLDVAYYFVTDSNTFLAVLTGLSAFMFFLNLKIKNSIIINRIGASTFGVLLIHANSDTMRQWLWGDVFNNVGAYDSGVSFLHSIATVLIVFTLCTLIDMGRIHFIEIPFFSHINQLLDQLLFKYNEFEKQIISRIKKV